MRRSVAELLKHDTLTVARELLGWVLIHDSAEGRTSGRIVETEAYVQGDPASHSTRGRTRRNNSMFCEAGVIYVYKVHMQHCINIVTAPEGTGDAVLIRALEPLDGISLMRQRRGNVPDRLLCAGPGRLTQAMGIDRTHDGLHILTGPISLMSGDPVEDEDVSAGSRIGIRDGLDLPWRFCVRSSRYLSRPLRL